MAKQKNNNKLSESDLLTIKGYMKNAKDDFVKKNFDDCIEWCEYILEIDNKSYLAMLLKGKCLNMLKKFKDALKVYSTNIDIDSTNTLGYKGKWEVFNDYFKLNSSNSDSLEKFENDICTFDVLFEFLHAFYLKCQEANDSLTYNNIVTFIIDFKNKVPQCESALLSKCIPDSDPKSFFNTIGHRIYSKKDSLLKSLKFELKAEKSKKIKFKALYQMKDEAMYKESLCDMFLQSPVERIYVELIGCIIEEEDHDIVERFQYEEELVDYRLEKCSYLSTDEKTHYFESEVLEYIDNLVLIGSDQISQKIFNLHLDWMDFGSLQDDLNHMKKLISKYITRFPQDKLTLLLFTLIMNPQNFLNIEGDEIESIKEEMNLNENLGDADLCYGAMLDIMEDLKNTSLLANRLVVNHLTLIKKYDEALPIVQKGIQMCKTNYIDYGYNMPNTKLSFSLDLALIYTYVDSPKYHSLAIKLYDQYINIDPNNLRAKYGKAMILIERDSYDEAALIITEYLEQNPESLNALERLSYCELKLNNYQLSLKYVDEIMKISARDGNPLDTEFECQVRYQQSLMYLERFKIEEHEDDLDLAYETLIKCIKINEYHWKSYQQLGILYSEYILDSSRAFKCFWKAFFLFNGDILSAHYIVKSLCDKQEWKIAASVCKDLIDSGYVKRELQFENWPYRVLGIHSLNTGQIDEAIDYLQNSMRINNEDKQTLVTLGQAYLENGKVEAALKVFSRTIELYPDYEYGVFFYAIVLSRLGKFEEAEVFFNGLCFDDETVDFKDCYLLEYISHLANYAEFLNQQGFLSKSCLKAEKIIECVHVCIHDLKLAHFNSLWTNLNRALRVFLSIGSKHDDVPIESLIDIFESAGILENELEILKYNPVSIESLTDDDYSTSDVDFSETVGIICKCMILAAKCSFIVNDYEKSIRAIRASLWFNLATAEFTTAVMTGNVSFRDMAIESFKRSIKFQSNVSATWNGLGMATMDINYRVSQHCFVKALSISSTEPLTYNNLAILALKYKDTEFANDLFTKSQAMFPINYFSWFGLALSYNLQGMNDIASKYFKHSFVLSKGKSDFIAIYYAMSVLKENFANKGQSNDILALQEFIFTSRSLEMYLKKKPHDTLALQSLLVLLERVKEVEKAMPIIEDVISKFEAKIDESMENDLVLTVCRLKSQYARMLMVNGDYSKSLSEAESSKEIAEFAENVTDTLKMSNDVVIALCQFFQGQIDDALSILRSYKYESVLEILFKISFQGEKQITFESWDDAKLLKVYAAIGLLNKDEEIMKKTLKHLCKNNKVEEEEVLNLVLMIHEKLNRDGNKQILQRSLFMNPNNIKAWEREEPSIAFKLMNKKPLQLSTPEVKSDMLIKTGNINMIQRALFLTPWLKEPVKSLYKSLQ
ncbi:hypothetical protein ACO0OL_000039 [Hanseniaspora opuntiae]